MSSSILQTDANPNKLILFSPENSCLYISSSLCVLADELPFSSVTHMCSNSEHVNTRNKGLTLFKPEDPVDQCIMLSGFYVVSFGISEGATACVKVEISQSTLCPHQTA